MTAKHAPTPWRQEAGVLIRGANGELVVELLSIDVDANAQFIITAVNSHAALLEACEFALRFIPEGRLTRGKIEDAIAKARNA